MTSPTINCSMYYLIQCSPSHKYRNHPVPLFSRNFPSPVIAMSSEEDTSHSLHCLLAATFFLACYLLIKRAQSYWSKYNVPSPPFKFLFGHSLPQLLKQKNNWQLFQEYYRQFRGKTRLVGLYFLTTPAALILDLDLMKRLLITDFETFDSRGVYFNDKEDPISAHLFSIGGNKWRRLRNKLSPTFTSGKLKGMFPIMVDISRNFSETVGGIVEANPEGFMIKNVTSRYTTDVIGSCAFGLNCNSLVDPENEFRRKGDQVFRRSLSRTIAGLFKQAFPDLSRKLGLKAVPDHIGSFFSKTVAENVRYREENSSSRNDFMDLLVKIKRAEKAEERLTLDEIVSQSFIFFVAGFETSSSTMMFALFELAQRVDIQERAREHILAVLEKHGGDLTYEALMEMDYLDRVVNETLRMYPPVPTLTRKANRDYKIPDSDVVIRKGMNVLLPTYAIQRDPVIYENPDEFDPERFTKEAMGQRHPCAFSSFGEGPRICIGARFGMIQAKVGLVALLRAFRFTLSEKTEIPVPMDKLSVLIMPEDDIHLKVQRI